MPAISGFVDFDPVKDIPSLKGKVVFITGGMSISTAGLGKMSVEGLAKHDPAHIYFSGRNVQAGQALISEVKSNIGYESLTFVEMDLSSLASVKAAASTISHDRLDVLMCNAGVMDVPPALSKDGYEIHFALNHLGHAMLIEELLPTLCKTAEAPDSDVRIISLTSNALFFHPKDGITFSELTTKQDGGFRVHRRYAQSKLANVLYAKELARRYPQITSVSVHPGVVTTQLITGLPTWRKWMIYVANFVQGISLIEPEKGCLSQLWAAAGAKKTELVNGAYYMPIGIMANDKLDATAKDGALAERLWTWTEKALSKV